MKTKRNKIEKGDTMIYEEKRFMAVSEIEKECCTGCCFYDNGKCQLENPDCLNSGIIWVQKEDYMSEISEKAIKLAIEAMRPIPVYSSPCYSVIDNRSPEEKHEEEKIVYDTILMIGDASGKEGQFSDSDKKTAENFGCEYMDVDDFVDKYKD